MWYKQIRSDKGEITWKQNVILPPKPDLKSDALRISQLHAMDLVDINGDGLKDIVTGKRFWAHGPTGDVEPDAPAVVYWFELRRDKEKGVRVHPAPDRRRLGRRHAGDGRGSQRRRHPRRDRRATRRGRSSTSASRRSETGIGCRVLRSSGRATWPSLSLQQAPCVSEFFPVFPHSGNDKGDKGVRTIFRKNCLSDHRLPADK